jgi:hypothetical protein
MSMTVDGGGQSRARNRSSASPPRLWACVRDQSVDEGGLPYLWRHSCIASRTQSRVRVMISRGLAKSGSRERYTEER